MQLTTARLKQIIKEELEAITNEMGDTTDTETTDLTADEQEVASLEQQLAEAKKKVEMGKKAAMKSGKMPGKRGDAGMKKVGPEQTFSSAKSAMKPLGKKGKWNKNKT